VEGIQTASPPLGVRFADGGDPSVLAADDLGAMVQNLADPQGPEGKVDFRGLLSRTKHHLVQAVRMSFRGIAPAGLPRRNFSSAQNLLSGS